VPPVTMATLPANCWGSFDIPRLPGCRPRR
jgi:hypothetical protein